MDRRKELQGLINDPNMKLTFAADRVQVAESGDLAYSRGHFAITTTDPKTSKPVDSQGSYLTVYKKQADGSWKAAEDFITPGPATRDGGEVELSEVGADVNGGRVRIGIGGWTYPPWRGVFYPDKLPQAKELEYASSELGAIEINATFYGRQKPKSWEAWEKVAPEGFQFAIKGSRFCVMRSQAVPRAPKGSAISSRKASRRLGQSWGRSCGSSPGAGSSIATISPAFIDLLPETLDGITLRHAIEPRHDSFKDDKFFELCRARNIAIVFEDSDEYPCIDVDTADFSLRTTAADARGGRDRLRAMATLDAFAEPRTEVATARPRRLHIHDQRCESSAPRPPRLPSGSGSHFNLR